MEAHKTHKTESNGIMQHVFIRNSLENIRIQDSVLAWIFQVITKQSSIKLSLLVS